MTNEKLSAWIDGELRDQDVGGPHSPANRETCNVWWLIGDVMRKEPVLAHDFTERVMGALQLEPTVLAPKSAAPVVPVGRRQSEMPRWMALAAAVAGVAVVAWAALNNGAANVPQGGPAVASSTANPMMVSLARKDETEDDRSYLVAHQAYGPGIQMAGISGYVRPASFDQPLVASR